MMPKQQVTKSPGSFHRLESNVPHIVRYRFFGNKAELHAVQFMSTKEIYPGFGHAVFRNDVLEVTLAVLPSDGDVDAHVENVRKDMIEGYFIGRGWAYSEVIASSDTPLVEPALRGFHPPVHDTTPSLAEDYRAIKWQAVRSWLVRNAITAVVVFVIGRALGAAFDAITGRRQRRS